MKTFKLILLITILMALGSGIWAQTAGADSSATGKSTKAPSMVLEYFDDDQQLKIYNSEGFEYGSIYLGMELYAGDRIKTLKSSAELRMIPNNSIFKIGASTDFQIKVLANPGGVNEFSLLEGKIRMVAAKTSGKDGYRFTTPTALAGVRGTDFGMEVSPGKVDKLLVRQGVVEFTKVATNSSLSLSEGMGADTFASDFSAKSLTTQELADFFANLNFVVLNPGQVPGLQPVVTTTPPKASQPQTTAAPDTPQLAEPAAAKALNKNSTANVDAIKKVLGIEVGTLILDGVTHGKLIVQPKIIVPDFKAVFYLPIIYKNDLFNAGDWYRPNGNNEWSFGTDQNPGDISGILLDIARDLVLKIKYIEIAKPNDPFFLQVGNIPSMTLGHGFLIGGYANDGDFPAVRRLGVNLGLNGGAVAFETMVNDLAQPEIYGARFVWRPVYPSFKLGTGLSIAADINPLSSISDDGASSQQTLDIQAAKQIMPMLFNVGIDLDLPIIESALFSIKAFGDFGGLIPYFTKGFSRADGSTVSEGFQVAHFFTLNTYPSIGIGFQNYGIETGVMGNISIVDYRLDFEYSEGNFQPSYIDQSYDRTRAQRAIDLINQYKNPAISEEGIIKMGIFGKLGVNILDTAYLSAGYKWPWTISDLSGIDYHNPDFFSFSLSFAKDRLPYGIGFSIAYERSYFVNMFTDINNFFIFDQYAILKTSVEVPIGSLFSLHLAVGTSAKRAANGDIDLSAGHPTMMPTVIIESVF